MVGFGRSGGADCLHGTSLTSTDISGLVAISTLSGEGDFSNRRGGGEVAGSDLRGGGSVAGSDRRGGCDDVGSDFLGVRGRVSLFLGGELSDFLGGGLVEMSKLLGGGSLETTNLLGRAKDRFIVLKVSSMGAN